MKNVLAAFLLLAAGLGLAESLEAAEFSGRPLKMTAVTADDGVAFQAVDQWVTVPDMIVDFTTTKQGPAVASFCLEVTTGTPLLIRIRQPGVGDWDPGPTRLVDATTTNTSLLFQTHCFSWFTSLSADTYRIKAQWMNLLGSGVAPEIKNRSLRVDHEN